MRCIAKCPGCVALQLLVFAPQVLRRAVGDLDVGEILGQRQQRRPPAARGSAASRRSSCRRPRPARRRCSTGCSGNASAMMRVHQLQRTGHHRAAGFARGEEVVFVDLLGHRVVADEHHLGVFVVACQEQVQQHEEALGDVLALFVHRSRHVEQAEHHRLRRRLRNADPVVVAQVEGVDEGHRVDARAQPRDLAPQTFDLRVSRLRLILQSRLQLIC